MDEKQQNVKYYGDEIDLKELFIALWKRKILIISRAVIGAVLAGIFSLFILSPTYNARLNIVISMPATCATKYVEYMLPVAEDGVQATPITTNVEYILPITTNEQYLNLITSNDVLENTIKDMGYDAGKVSLEGLKKRISIEKFNSKAGTVQNSFDVSVSADNPQEAVKLAKALYDNYIEFMDIMTNERAASYYHNYFSDKLKSSEAELISNKDILKKNEALLTKTPQTINQKAAMQEIQDKLTGTSDYVVLENIINPNYTKIENDIIKNKQIINIIENKISVYNKYLKDIEKEIKAIKEYYGTGKANKLESSVIGVVKTSIYLPSSPATPSQKTSPKNAQNVAIGFIIGAMIGGMAVYIKEFWLRKEC